MDPTELEPELLSPPSSAAHPAVSVVVCTRDRGSAVTATLGSILANVGADLDVIVVDQSQDDATSDAIARMPRDARLRYIRSETVGVSAARNIGLRLARHQVVLFTDDDVTVPDDWVRIFAGAVEPLTKVAVGFCTVEAAPHNEALGFVPDHWVEKRLIVKSLWSKSRARGIGAGMAVRRDAVLGIGGFDEQLGPGAPLRSGEDRDLAARALTLGWWVYQTPDTSVVHHGFRTWREGQELTRRDWYGIGAAYAKQVKAGNVRIIPVILHEVVYFGLLMPIYTGLRGRPRAGLKRLAFFGVGFVRGLRMPVDRSTSLYRPRRRLSNDG